MFGRGKDKERFELVQDYDEDYASSLPEDDEDGLPGDGGAGEPG